MTWQDVTPDRVLLEVRAGHTTRPDLASVLGVLPSSKWLHDAIEALVGDGLVTEHGLELVPHDLPKEPQGLWADNDEETK